MNDIAVEKPRFRGGIAVNLGCTVAEHIISASVAFLLTPYLIKRLGMSLYGLYPIVLEFSAIFGIVFGVINSTACKYIAVEAEKNNYSDASKYFSAVFYSNIAFSFFLMLPMILLIVFCGLFLEIPQGHVGEIRGFMILAFASVVIDAVTVAFSSVYYVTNRLELKAIAGLAGVAVKAATLFVLLYFFKPSMISVGVSLILSSAVIGSVGIIICSRLSKGIDLSLRFVSFPYVKRIAASGFWYSVNRIAAVLVTGGMLIVANILLSPDVSGEYSVAYIFVNAVCGVLLTVASVFVPINARHFARGEENRLRDGLLRDEKILGLCAAVIFSVSLALGESFFTMWLGGSAEKSLVNVAFILLLPTLSLSCATPIINVGMVINRTRRLSLLFLCGGLFSVAASLCVAYFTSLGGTGIALISAASQILWYFLAVPCFAGRAFSRSPKIFLVPLVKTHIAALVSLCLGLLLSSVCNIEGWLDLLIVGGAVGTVSLFVSFFVIFGNPRNTLKNTLGERG